MAEKAKKLDATVTLVTLFPDSTIGKIAEVSIKLAAQSKTETGSEYKTRQPMRHL